MEPNGGHNENCVAYHAGGWFDVKCDAYFAFLCEI